MEIIIIFFIMSGFFYSIYAATRHKQQERKPMASPSTKKKNWPKDSTVRTIAVCNFRDRLRYSRVHTQGNRNRFQPKTEQEKTHAKTSAGSAFGFGQAGNGNRRSA